VDYAVNYSDYSDYAQYPESCVPQVTRRFIFFRKGVPEAQPAVAWRCPTGLDMVRRPRHLPVKPECHPASH